MSWEFTIENIAGIRSGQTTVRSGINAVRSSNWQGKSSFITAVRTAMGTTAVLTEGTEQGSVELVTDTDTYTVTVSPGSETTVTSGDPYLSDERTQTIAELYAFLGEENSVRQVVRNGESLEDVLLRPLDFENIDEQIADRKHEREQVERELEQAEKAATKLPQAEETVRDLKENLQELENRRAELSSDRLEGEQLTERREELSSTLAERERVTNQIDRLEDTLDRTREKLEARRTELADLDMPDLDDDLEAQLANTREQYERTKRDADLLQSIYAPTKRLLDENRLELITDIDHGVAEDTAECWTCGSEASREEIERQIEELSEQITELRQQARKYSTQVDELAERQEDRRDAERRKGDLEDRIDDLVAKREDRESSLETVRSRLTEMDERIEELSQEVETEDEQLTDVESEIKYTRARIEDARDEREKYASQTERREMLQTELDDLTEEITELRTRKENMKQRTREAFDDAMRDVLDRFDTGFESARLTSEFDLIVAREGRETDLYALSEGETELLGLVAALAGFTAFETDDIPIMLVDSLNSLDDENLQTLVTYLAERVEYLVVTTYPEHSSFENHTIDPTEWTVVSPQTVE